jgi:hypothetical protein
MLYLTSDGKIASKLDDVSMVNACNVPTFSSEQELHEIACRWPMQRLVEIWNGLPGARPIRKFEDRNIAVGRIWRAVQADPAQHRGMIQSNSSRARNARPRITFRELSKAAQICDLLRRPEGATLDEIITLTGWQRHTVRGFVSASLRKRGTTIRTFKRDGEHVYRLKS